MTLATGTRLASYEILSPIGAGGMGEVYRARDPKLRRDVAIKVLPENFGKDADALARFEREAHAVAAFSHPNILSIFDFGTHDGSPYAVMELLEGETLRERLVSGPIPRKQAIDYAVQIANGLAAAHDKGIIHRDLKPENIFITKDGRVKILDFGLAKQAFVAPAEEAMPTERRQTTPGTLVGTIGYMSPEQVRGGEIDPRSDIFSFGAVLYEMFSGRRAFKRDSSVETMNAILNDDAPDLSDSGGTISPAIIRIVEHCLEKNPSQRFQSAHDVAFALDALSDSQRSNSSIGAFKKRRFRWFPFAAIVVGAAGIASLVTWFVRPVPKPPIRMMRFSVEGLVSEFPTTPLISPDGTKIAYVQNGQLHIERLDDVDDVTIDLATTEASMTRIQSFFWSADSSNVAFTMGRRLWRVASSGGTPSAICDVPDSGAILGGDWGSDDVIVFSAWRGSLYHVLATGGTAELLLRLDPQREIDFHYPQVLPDGRGVMFIPHWRTKQTHEVDVLAGGKRSVILGETFPILTSRVVYAPPGYLLMEQNGQEGIWAVPFSLATLRPTGAPYLAVREGSSPSVSHDGSLLWVRGAIAPTGELVRVMRNGIVSAPIGLPGREPSTPVFSPDGRQIAVSLWENNTSSIWLYDVARGSRSRLTSGTENELNPAWSPSGDRIFFIETRAFHGTIKSVAATSGGDEQTIPNEFSVTRLDVSHDGTRLVFGIDEGGGRGGIRFVPLDQRFTPAGPVQPIRSAATNARRVQLSPQGDLLAFQGERGEIFIHSFPAGDARWQVSTAGGISPCWSRSGDRIYFLSRGDLMEVDVTRVPSLTLSAPRKLFSLTERRLRPGAEYDVDADGNFVMVREAGKPPTMVVAINGVRLLAKSAK